jgi:hypothetical protein
MALDNPSGMAKHHHVPQFLLTGWCGPDGKLAVYSRKAGRMVIDRHVKKLDSDERSAWGRFMLAQWHRSPEKIAELRRGGRAVLEKELARAPEEYDAVKDDSAHPTLVDWVDANTIGLDEIVTMGRVLPQLVKCTGKLSISARRAPISSRLTVLLRVLLA